MKLCHGETVAAARARARAAASEYRNIVVTLMLSFAFISMLNSQLKLGSESALKQEKSWSGNIQKIRDNAVSKHTRHADRKKSLNAHIQVVAVQNIRSTEQVVATTVDSSDIQNSIPLTARKHWFGGETVGEGSCQITKRVKGTRSRIQTTCLPHGFCSKDGTCKCVASYEGPACTTPKRKFGGIKSSFRGQFSLSSPHVRHLKVITFSTSSEGDPRTFLKMPVKLEGKLNARVWKAITQGRLLDMEPVVSATMLNLLPKDDRLGHTLFETCAVVGNGGINIAFPFGADIDGHDAVFRINNGPTQTKSHNFQPYVGTKTSIRVVSESHLNAKEGNELRLLHVNSKAGIYSLYQHIFDTKDMLIQALDVDFSQYVASVMPNSPSLTLVAVLLALQKCAHVTVYGVHGPTLGNNFSYLYFNDGSEVETNGILSAKEEEIVKNLAKDGALLLANPCIAGCEEDSGIPNLATLPPGSACACVNVTGVPAALPGFCHLAGKYGCFYSCRGIAECEGGPEHGNCPEEVEEQVNIQSLNCATDQDLPTYRKGTILPPWARKDVEGKGPNRTEFDDYEIVKGGKMKSHSTEMISSS